MIPYGYMLHPLHKDASQSLLEAYRIRKLHYPSSSETPDAGKVPSVFWLKLLCHATCSAEIACIKYILRKPISLGIHFGNRYRFF